MGIEPTRYLYRRILNLVRTCPSSTLLCYGVHLLHKVFQKTSILSIISMLWFPNCTQAGPGMKKERRLKYLSKLNISNSTRLNIIFSICINLMAEIFFESCKYWLFFDILWLIFTLYLVKVLSIRVSLILNPHVVQ